MLTIQEHGSAKYAPRTYFNAKQANLTLAVAIDFTTAGERCTAKAAGDKMFKIHANSITDILVESRRFYKACTSNSVETLNIAGNGIYTWAKHGYTQERINSLMVELLKPVHQYYPLKKIVTGGQTGSDLAGAVAAYRLGIECVVTLPKGYVMRFEDGKDVEMSDQFVREMIEHYSSKIY